MPAKSQHLKLDINLGIGTYTATIFLGSQKQPATFILDTGSSTLAVSKKAYQATTDTQIQATTYAQDVTYGDGGWAGPVLKTDIRLSHDDEWLLHSAPFALICDQQQNNFMLADGIWGLAYHHLNRAYDMSDDLAERDLKYTHPWPYEIEDTPAGIKAFKKILKTHPEHDITPLFTAFEEANITPNQFTFITHRTIEYVPKSGMSTEEIAALPQNQGQMIIGTFHGDEHQKQSLKVFHDAYYNVHLQSVRVAGFDPCPAPELDEAHQHNFFTNAIVDSGSSFLMLQRQLYAYVMDCFEKINPAWPALIDTFNKSFQAGKEFTSDQIDPSKWPALYFEFAGPNGTVATIPCAASHYWQSDAKGPNQWFFTLINQIPKWPDQSLIGLPLMNGHACQFDRSIDQTGQIHFYPKPD